MLHLVSIFTLKDCEVLLTYIGVAGLTKLILISQLVQLPLLPHVIYFVEDV